jgi:hypothetical protein
MDAQTSLACQITCQCEPAHTSPVNYDTFEALGSGLFTTAKALGPIILEPFLLRADKVVE